jgi:tRNA(Ile)-lysidine synthase
MALCAPFETKPRLAIAVSGGPDSMALLLLSQHWAQQRGGSVVALTVNHGLRAEAAAEAAQVGQWCAALAIEHSILDWQPPKNHAGMQAKARDGRYGLLTEWCRKRHVLHLLTAHTLNDQCETVLFRLGRGSQMEGLSAMPLACEVEGVRLLRPLLRTPKAALYALLNSRGQAWVEDPSNAVAHYSRNRIRRELHADDGDGTIAERAGAVAARFGDMRNALFYKTVESLTDVVSLYPEGYALVDSGAFCRMSPYERERLLAALIPALTGDYHPPRGHELRQLQADIVEGGVSRTLAGLLFRPWQGNILVCREAAALPAALPLSPLWDGRFRLSGGMRGDGWSVRPLGASGLAWVEKAGRVPSYRRIGAALRALPSLWHLEALVAAPHIPYQNPEFADTGFEAVFHAAKPLAGSPFFSFNNQPCPISSKIYSFGSSSA